MSIALPHPFFQTPPRLGNQYDDDALLGEYIARVLPRDLAARHLDEWRELGELSGGKLLEAQLEDRLNEPRLTQWDGYGRRVDRIELTSVWKNAQRIAAERGLVAIAYERRDHEHSRVHQFIANYLVQASLDIYACPLAMTDGAARTLLDHENQALIDRALPHLASRDPATFWTSGQWMTERTGGSDVGLSETEAKKDAAGSWRLYGTKFYTSAATSEMALTLGRPEGNGEGGKGLALFYVETRDDSGALNHIKINRLKDKTGTRKLPTAELDLEGTIAHPVAGLSDGVRNITSMLNVTRMWNSAAGLWGMRRAIALAQDYARRRVQFGARLVDKPLHADTLAGVVAEFEGAFHLGFRVVELMGRIEAGVATDDEKLLARVLTPIAKLTTGKQAVEVASEAAECFGAFGYMEDTGLGLILRDLHVLPLWEGTTNVLSLDALRALSKPGVHEALGAEIRRLLASVSDPRLAPCVERAQAALKHAAAWLGASSARRDTVETGARRFAMTIGRIVELALLASHAQFCLATEHGDDKGQRALAAARRFARHGVDLVTDTDEADDAESRWLA